MLFEALTQDFSEIQKHLEDRLAEAPPLDDVAEAIYPRDKWLLSSALQKLIRRGQAREALGVAYALHALDPTYLARRLPIIALEDIGIADLVLCFDALVAFGAKGALGRRFEQIQLITNLVYRLAGSVKCRTACDLLCLAHARLESRSKTTGFATPSLDGLVQLVTDRSVSDTNRALALHHLSGLTLRHGRWARSFSRFNAGALDLVALKLNLPPVVRSLVLRGRNTLGLAAMLPLVTEVVRKEAGRIHVKTASTSYFAPPIAGLPEYAFDMHTGAGRMAIGQFARQLQASRARAFGSIPENQFARLISIALFHVEGSVLESSLSSPELDLYRERIELTELQQRGLPDVGRREELYSAIDAGHWKLWELRCLACDALHKTGQAS